MRWVGKFSNKKQIFKYFDQKKIKIHAHAVHLEREFTSSLAASLADSPVWARELKGFFLGDLGAKLPSQLTAMEPYRPGRIPVVFVHGTASGHGRWADMVNDLIVDPTIHDRFQFWFFTYDTGSPILYSAGLFRDTLEKTVHQLDEKYHDPVLQRMVIIGHSQGGPPDGSRTVVHANLWCRRGEALGTGARQSEGPCVSCFVESRCLVCRERADVANR